MADTRYDRIFRAFLTIAVLLLLASAQPVEAQQQQRDMGNWDADRSSATQSQVPSSGNLPSWAEPGMQTRDVPGGGVTSKALPGTPGENPPQQIPVDGGLALLAMAGAGYAVRKLRHTPDDSE